MRLQYIGPCGQPLPPLAAVVREVELINAHVCNLTFARMRVDCTKVRGGSVGRFPPVPLTLEGSSLLHQFFRFDWKAWRATPAERNRIAVEAVEALKSLEAPAPARPVRTALFSQLGHKGDLILIHFRDSLEALNQVELDLAQTELYGYLTPATPTFRSSSWASTSPPARPTKRPPRVWSRTRRSGTLK